MWTQHATSRTLSCSVEDPAVQSWTAEHDGYHRLEMPVTHRRSVTLDSGARQLTVTDSLVPPGSDREAADDAVAAQPVPVVTTWQLGPEVHVELDGSRAELTWEAVDGPRHARLGLAPELEWSAHRGETGPIRGWYAPRFGERVPATLLAGRGSVDPATTLVTNLELP